MRYASVCDGIGAVHVAWRPLGWECAWTSEIEPFPAAVVEHHWKSKNLGDMTKLTEEQLNAEGPISLLVGGTPCQSFSVAGLRKGLEDPRGNLALRFTQLVGVLRPTWVVWENVPGVLSSAGGRDFGTFLGALAELGYGFAYRILDAQWFGVAQRRRRVFVVAHARDWRCAAAVLFERESVFGNPPTRRASRQTITGPIAGCSNGGGANGPGRTADDADSLIISPTLRGRANSSHRADSQAFVPDGCPALKARDHKGPSSDGDGDGATLVPVAFKENMSAPDAAVGLCPTLQAENFHAVAFAQNQREEVRELGDVATALQVQGTHQQTFVATPFDTTQITSKANYSQPKPGDPCHPIAAGAHSPAIALTTEQTPKFRDNCAFSVTAQSPSGGGQRQCVAYDILGTLATSAAKPTDVHVALRSRMPGQSEASTTTIVAQGFTHSGYSNQPAWLTGDRTDCLPASGHGDTSNQGVGVVVALDGGNQSTNEDIHHTLRIGRDSGDAVAVGSDELAGTLRANQGSGWRSNGTPVEGVAISHMAVRRLTPRECERLQGFSDDYTAVPYRNKTAADGPRYKALGNSMAVPVMAWIGRRIAEVEATDGR